MDAFLWPRPLIHTMRAICCVLAPLTGERATGKAVVRATGADVDLPPNVYLVPAPEGPGGGFQLDFTRLLKTAGGPPVKGKAQPVKVTSAGTEIDVFSALGGLRMNLKPDTRLRFDPPVKGLRPEAVLTSDGLSGGAPPLDDLEAVQSIAIFEGVAARQGATFFQAGTGLLPALMLSFERSTPVGKTGINLTTRRHHFRLWVAVDRLDDTNPRRDQGLALLDALAELLLDRSSVDGEVFSSPPIDGGDAGRIGAWPGVYVYTFDFHTTHTTRRRDDRIWTPWRTTRAIGQVPEDSDHPGDPKVVVDETIQMPPKPV